MSHPKIHDGREDPFRGEIDQLVRENTHLRAELDALRNFCSQAMQSATDSLRDWAVREGMTIEPEIAEPEIEPRSISRSGEIVCGDEREGGDERDDDVIELVHVISRPVAHDDIISDAAADAAAAMAERRRHDRVRLDLPARICSDAAPSRAGSVRDVSLSGLFLCTREPLPVGARVACGFFVQMHGRRQLIKLAGRVSRVIEGAGFAVTLDRRRTGQRIVVATLLAAVGQLGDADDGLPELPPGERSAVDTTCPGGWWPGAEVDAA